MLRELRIQNYAIIDEVSLEFSEGFNIITGETGAGKSILIDALSLVLGGRASPEEIREGKDEAVVEARFDPISVPSILEDTTSEWLILRRVISRSGKSRAYANGSFVNLSTLEILGQKLAEIHGQHERLHLTDLRWQLDLLDAFGRLLDERLRYEAHYTKWASLQKERDELSKRGSAEKRQEEFLRFQLSEIQEAKLSPDEEALLKKEERALKNWDEVLSMTRKAYALLSEEGGAITPLEEVGNEIKKLKEVLGDAASELELWEGARAQLKELSGLLRRRFEGVEFDSARFEQITERLYLIQKLSKKYGASVDTILEYQRCLEAELFLLSSADDRLHEIEEEIKIVQKEVRATAEILSRKREEVKSKLEKRVQAELDFVGMEKTRFEIFIGPTDLSKAGADRVEFLIALAGEKPQGLGKIASGGELSRIMLALKVSLTEVDPVATMIFDEVDAGIGGGVAEKVGKRLETLSRKSQIFCITHLPQVARFAQNHYFVEKKAIGKRTVASVQKLSREERVQELARMLGGVTITPITLQHAEEMVQAAGPTVVTSLPQIKPPKKERNR